MASFRRYAVYWAPPPDSALARFGAAWLGWDAEGGKPAPHPDVPGLPLSVAEITETPRRYGFHATLKAPFRPKPGVALQDLEAQGSLVGRETAPFEVPPLRLERIGPFIALVPSAPCAPLDALAGRLVEDFHDCVAEPTQAELDRRRPGLTGRQEQHLERWFYPYVFDEYRFHLTLTGPLPPEHAGTVFEALIGLTAPFRAAPLPINGFCLFGEDAEGRFHVVGRYELTG